MNSLSTSNHLGFSFSNKKQVNSNQPQLFQGTEKKYREVSNEHHEAQQTLTNKKYQKYNSGRNVSFDYDKQILTRLDQSQKKLIMSQKNYGDLWKKFQMITQKNKVLNKQLGRSQQKRLSQLMDIQNKFRLLQDENQTHNQMLMAKQNTIGLLRQKLKQKTDKLAHIQKQLQAANTKMINLTYKNKENQLLRKKQNLHQLQSLTFTTQLQQINGKYQNQIESLRQQLKKFQGIILNKQKQKRSILDDIDKLNTSHKQQVLQIKRQFAKIQDQYKKWIQKSNQQKIEAINSYQKQLKEQRNSSFIKPIDSISNVQNLLKQQIKLLQNQNFNLSQLNKESFKQIQELRKRQKQWVFKLSHLQNIQIELKAQINSLNKSKNNLSQKIRKLQRQKNQQNIKIEQQAQQLQDLRKQFDVLFKTSQQLNKKNMQIQQKNTNLIQQLLCLKKDLSISKNCQLNMNKKLTEVNKKLNQRIDQMAQRQQNILSQLYSQRLQNDKLVQQKQQQKLNLRKQYELSIKNMKNQLSKQIKMTKMTKMGSSQTDQEKQNLYLQIRELQKNYQLLMSQIVTVDDMMNIATKVHKRHSKFIKK